MKAIENGPHGFTTYGDFWRQMGDLGEKVKLNKAQKVDLVSRLVLLEDPKFFFPYDGITEELMATARVREVRKLPKGGFYVRYAVSVLYCEDQWDGPYDLMVCWSATGQLRAYTFLFGKPGCPKFAANQHVERGDRVEDRFTTSKGDVIEFLRSMQPTDSVLIGNDACGGEYISIGCEDGKLILSWQVCGRPWECTSTRSVTMDEAIRAVEVFEKKGVVGVQELGCWEGVEHYDSVSKKTFINIDHSLWRMLYFGYRTGDAIIVCTLRAIGVSRNAPLKSECEIAVGSGTQKREDLLSEIFRSEIPWDKAPWRKGTKAAICANKLLVYLAIHRYRPAQEKLAERFRLGDSIPKDARLANIWQRIADEADDATPARNKGLK